MDAGYVTVLVFLILVSFLASGTVIFVAMIGVSVVSLWLFAGFPLDRLGATLARIMIRSTSSWELSAIPLFVWMGEIAFRTSLTSRMFRGLTRLVARLPGGLLHTNVFGCALFAAVSGSSAATTATVGKITLSELRSQGYNQKLALGSLAGAGTLGLLIPPSVVMIIYGLLAEVSIVRLFASGLLPGLMIALFYSLYIAARCVLSPDDVQSGAPEAPSRSLVGALVDLWPITALILAVLGSIYTGWATPSESAAVGVIMALVLATVHGEVSIRLVLDSLAAAIPTSCMICSLLAAAALLSTTMGFLHIPQDIATFIAGFDLGKTGLIIVLSIFFIILGMFLDGISITVMTLPITLPLVVQHGIDPIWFGVFLVIMVELGQMTPPVGFNLFILQGMSGVPLLRVAAASIPFFLLMCLGVVVITIFPQIVLWLPAALFGS